MLGGSSAINAVSLCHPDALSNQDLHFVECAELIGQYFSSCTSEVPAKTMMTGRLLETVGPGMR